MITIYTHTYNSEIILPFFIKFYRERFPNCKIVIYDNESLDNTVAIAKSLNCDAHVYSTNGVIDFRKGHHIKNNSWKDATTEWVLMSDSDEMIDINEDKLQKETELGSTLISSEAYTMVNMEDNLDLDNIRHGFRDKIYDKILIFNKQKIVDINYDFGSHRVRPRGHIQYSINKYRMYHYHFLNPELTMLSYKNATSRLTQESIRHGWGSHYLRNDEAKIKELFIRIRNSSNKLF